MSLGDFNIDDVLTFYAQTSNPATGAEVDADAVPSYRIYEEETGTAILTGNMALLDSTNTDGFYSEQITLSTASGFENGKSYCIRKSAAVSAVTGAAIESFTVGVTQAAAAAALTATVADSVPSVGTRPSIAQVAYMLGQLFTNMDVVGDTLTVYKTDGTTPLFTLTLDDDTNPTASTRAT